MSIGAYRRKDDRTLTVKYQTNITREHIEMIRRVAAHKEISLSEALRRMVSVAYAIMMDDPV